MPSSLEEECPEDQAQSKRSSCGYSNCLEHPGWLEYAWSSDTLVPQTGPESKMLPFLAVILLSASYVIAHHSSPQLVLDSPHTQALECEWGNAPGFNDHPGHVPRIWGWPEDVDLESKGKAPEVMRLYELHKSGPSKERIDLTFFADGYTKAEEDKFIQDAARFTKDLISPNGTFGFVADLLNIWGVFVPSETSGIGVEDTPIPGAAFGLYRMGPELRGVMYKHGQRVKSACEYWRENATDGGCDQPIILGNDPLYGGLGGSVTTVTASVLNGPLVLRHEIGHSLTPVGEEYEGGYVYCGVDADIVENLHDLKWKEFLTDPEHIRIEDEKVNLQAYPWHDLDQAPYKVSFNSSNMVAASGKLGYPKAALRMSLSSIPYPSHISLKLNSEEVDLTPAFSPDWAGVKDRRWVELPLPGLPAGLNDIVIELTGEGKAEPAGQGGKMMTSIEIMEFGGDERFNDTPDFIGAFPTYSLRGNMTLRPTNNGCVMRVVTHPTFCPICAKGLMENLQRKIKNKLY